MILFPVVIGRELDGDAQLVKLQSRNTSDQKSKIEDQLKVRLSLFVCVWLFVVCFRCLFVRESAGLRHHHLFIIVRHQ